mmetsp:Transcript_17373/g.35127  ORF Transcript_17373/g.35127 Transcript_17373/m.35127 type:complete len:128 (+) Transcript_17373:166-549(+)
MAWPSIFYSYLALHLIFKVIRIFNKSRSYSPINPGHTIKTCAISLLLLPTDSKALYIQIGETTVTSERSYGIQRHSIIRLSNQKCHSVQGHFKLGRRPHKHSTQWFLITVPLELKGEYSGILGVSVQ